MVILHSSWRLLKSKLAQKDDTGIRKRVGANYTAYVRVEDIEYDKNIPIFSKEKLEAFLRNRDSAQLEQNSPQQPRQQQQHQPQDQQQQPHKSLRKISQKSHSRTKQTSQPQESHKQQQSQPQQQPQTQLQQRARSQQQPQQQQQPPLSFSLSTSPSPSPQPKPQPQPQPQEKQIPQRQEPNKQLSPKPQKNQTPPRHELFKQSLPEPSSLKQHQRPQKHSHDQPQQSPKSHLEPQPLRDEVKVVFSKPGPSSSNWDRLPKKITKKRKKNESIWKGDVDELVIKEEIDDEFCKFNDDDSDDDMEISKNLKKIRPDAAPSKPKIPSSLNIKEGLSHPSPKKSPEKQAPPPKVVEPILPNWPETVRRFEENQLNIVYRDLFHFKSHVKSDERARTLPKEMILKCLQDDLAFLLIEMLALTFELNYNDDKDREFWSEIVGRLKRKLNVNCGAIKYKSNTNPDQIRDAYKRAVSDLDNYARDQNITLSLPYLDFKFLISSNTQPPPATELTVLTKNQPKKVSTPRQPGPKTEPVNIPQSGEAIPAPHPQPQQGPQLQTKSEAPLIPTHLIKNGLSPLQPLNKFNIKLLPDIKSEIKKENSNKQENADPTLERKLTFVGYEHGKSIFKIKTTISRNQNQIVRNRL